MAVANAGSADGSYLIRQETPADGARVGSVVADAFRSEVEAVLVERIRASPEFVPEMALVATPADGDTADVVGHVMISGAVLRSAVHERRIVMLSPLAVAPAHQRRGVGGALVRAVTTIADRLGEPLVVLEGSPRYYSRFGFVPARPLGITIHLPDWAPPDAAQVLCLSNYDGEDSTLQGTVVYPAAFDGLE